MALKVSVLKLRVGSRRVRKKEQFFYSSTYSLKWESKLVTHTIKTIAVNAFIVLLIFKKALLLERRYECGTLDRYQNSLNSVQSLAYFVYVSLIALRTHAEIFEKQRKPETAIVNNITELWAGEVRELITLSSYRKGKRIKCFNGPGSVNLRMQVRKPFFPTAKIAQYCVVCVNTLEIWRGHCTRKKVLEVLCALLRCYLAGCPKTSGMSESPAETMCAESHLYQADNFLPKIPRHYYTRRRMLRYADTCTWR